MKRFIFFAHVFTWCIMAHPVSLFSQNSQPEIPSYVVIGAFAYQKNAIHFTNDARRNKFPARFEMNLNRSLYYVYVLVTGDHEYAVAEALKLRKGTKYLDAWVYTGAFTKSSVPSIAAGRNGDINPVTGQKIETVNSEEKPNGPREASLAVNTTSGTQRTSTSQRTDTPNPPTRNGSLSGNNSRSTDSDETTSVSQGREQKVEYTESRGNREEKSFSGELTNRTNNPTRSGGSNQRSKEERSQEGSAQNNVVTNAKASSTTPLKSGTVITEERSSVVNSADRKESAVTPSTDDSTEALQDQSISATTQTRLPVRKTTTTSSRPTAKDASSTAPETITGDRSRSTDAASKERSSTTTPLKSGTVSSTERTSNVNSGDKNDPKTVPGTDGTTTALQDQSTRGATESRLPVTKATTTSGRSTVNDARSTTPAIESGEESLSKRVESQQDLLSNTASQISAIAAPVRESTQPLTAEEVVGKNFYFHLFRADNIETVPGEVDVIDFDKSRKMGSYPANEGVKVMMAGGKLKHVSLVCQVFGYRKVQREFEPNSPAEDFYLDDQGNLVIPFELMRLQKGDIAIMYNVFFFKDAAVMRPESRYEVNNLLDLLQENPSYKIVIHGHTNGNASGKIIRMGKPGNFYSLTGTSNGFGSAKELSEERATVIRDFLISSGIKAERMQVKAWGGKKPIHDKHSVRAQENVRVEIEILSQ